MVALANLPLPIVAALSKALTGVRQLATRGILKLDAAIIEHAGAIGDYLRGNQKWALVMVAAGATD